MSNNFASILMEGEAHNSSGDDDGSDGGLTSSKPVAETVAASQEVMYYVTEEKGLKTRLTNMISCPSSHISSELSASTVYKIKQGTSDEEQSQCQTQLHHRSFAQESYENILYSISSIKISNPSHQDKKLCNYLLNTAGSNMGMVGNSSMKPMSTTNLDSLPDRRNKYESDRESKKERNDFLNFTRVLLKYLERKDPPMHARAKLVIRKCAESRKRREKGFESLTTTLKKRLRETVGEAYWARAEAYLRHFERKRRKEKQLCQKSKNLNPKKVK
jgi:hypothetical protein